MTETFQIHRGDKIVFKVELVKGEIVVRKDGESFDRASLLVGEWRGMTDEDEEVRVTFNSNDTFEMVIVDPAGPRPVEMRATGKYTTDFSVSPAHLDLDATFDPRRPPRLGGDDRPETAPALGEPERQPSEKHKLKTIIELVDSNTLRMGEPNKDSRPKAFGVVLHRRGVAKVGPDSDWAPATEAPASDRGVHANSKPFGYDLSQVPAESREVYGYRPHQIREDGRFNELLKQLDQIGPNTFLMDENLEQVLHIQWANEDRTYSQPLMVLTVVDGTALEFAEQKLGVEVDEAHAEASLGTYYPVKLGDGFPMPEAQFFRFVDDKTFMFSSREFLDAHQIALKKGSNTDLLKIAASMQDGPLWAIGNTSDKDFVEEIKLRFSESPLAAVLMTQLPIWEDTSHLTLSLALGEDDPKLQFSAHALSPDKQTAITQTVRVLPVTLANTLRPYIKSSGVADAEAIGLSLIHI